jgi:signal transduction histidine kinase
VVDLLEVVTETTDLIGPLAAEREITLEGPDPGDGRWIVQADRQRLEQVLLNLASNAVKYNHHGGRNSIACAPEGEIVQELIRQQRPDLVLLDLHLPGIDGEVVVDGLLVPAGR